MEILTTTLGQMFVLFSLIFIGFFLAKIKVMPDNASLVLSRLENNLLLPALVLSTFINNFTVEKIGEYWRLLLISSVVGLVMVFAAILVAKCCSKDKFVQNIYTYGLSFSNFGFMGNAVVLAVFGDEILASYLIFTLPLWTLIYLWAVPTLLIPAEGEKQTLVTRLKSFANPMFGAMVLGMIIGLLGLNVPGPFSALLKSAGDCMSPIAMLLTGITVAHMDFKKVMSMKSIYVVSIVRLIVFPLIFIGLIYVLPLEMIIPADMIKTTIVCIIVSLAMPLGLSPIIIPSAYGKDTSVAAGATIASHVLSCVTIPIMFYLMNLLI